MSSSADNENEFRVEDENRVKLLELGVVYAVPMAISAAIKLGVADILFEAGTNLSASQILSQVAGSSKDSARGAGYLERILRLLSSRGIFKETILDDGQPSSRRFGLTGMSKHMLRKGTGASTAAWLLFHVDRVLMQPWEYLHEAVMEGDGDEPFKLAHGSHIFDYARNNSQFSSKLNLAMSQNSRVYMQDFLGVYKGFSGLRTLVDVGGGTGDVLSLIVAVHPKVKGINLDLEHVISGAPLYTGVTHVAGNMFEGVPQADACFLKFVLHNWDDPACIRILRNCYKSLSGGGKVIVMESILPAATTSDHNPASRLSLLMDVSMLVYCGPGGKERSFDEFNVLAIAAGFDKVSLVVTVDYISILEIFKV